MLLLVSIFHTFFILSKLTAYFQRYCESSDNSVNYLLDTFKLWCGISLKKSSFANVSVIDLIRFVCPENGNIILSIGILNHSYKEKPNNKYEFYGGRIALLPMQVYFRNKISGKYCFMIWFLHEALLFGTPCISTLLRWLELLSCHRIASNSHRM